MLKKLHTIASYLMIVLGLAHLSFTRLASGRLTLGALWFASAGLAIIFAAFLNLVLIGAVGTMSSSPRARVLCVVANVTTMLLFGVAATLLFEPQVFIGIALFGFAAAAALLTGKAGNDMH